MGFWFWWTVGYCVLILAMVWPAIRAEMRMRKYQTPPPKMTVKDGKWKVEEE